jgi:sigma-B regulation protein RsbU (phosphoserine phosphatase)
MLCAGGPVLGVFPDAQFEEGSFELQSGDLLVAYTDGLTEAMNSAGEEFGEERLCAVIAGLNGGTAKDALDQLVHQVTTWSKGTRQHDDITVVILKRI